MKKIALAVALTAGTVLAASPAFGQKSDQQGQGRAVVTILPSHPNDNRRPGSAGLQAQGQRQGFDGDELHAAAGVEQPGRTGAVDRRRSAQQPGDAIQRSSRRSSKEMPPNTKIAIAYMENGRAVFSSQLSSSADDVLKGLHLSAGFPGSNASPYFCLSDLAKNWPSHDRTARREVLMVTDGVDNYDRRLRS